MTGIPSWVRVGAKVVCINAEWLPGYGGKDEHLKNGDVYVITGLVAGMVTLAGVGVPKFYRRFRPLVTRTQQQDIAEHFGFHLHQKLPERA